MFARPVRAGGALLLKNSSNLANGSALGAEKKMIYEELYEIMVRRISCLEERELTVKKEEGRLKRNETFEGTK